MLVLGRQKKVKENFRMTEIILYLSDRNFIPGRTEGSRILLGHATCFMFPDVPLGLLLVSYLYRERCQDSNTHRHTDETIISLRPEYWEGRLRGMGLLTVPL